MRVGSEVQKQAGSTGAERGVRQGGGESRGSVQLKSQARGLDFAAGEALMAPPVVQRTGASSENGNRPTRDASERGTAGEKVADEGDPVASPIIMARVEAFDTYIREGCNLFQLSVNSIKGQIAAESDGLADATNGGHKGLMQLDTESWREGLKLDPQMQTWVFSTDWSDPRKNILVGCAALASKGQSITALMERRAYAQGKPGDGTMPKVDKDHPQFAEIAQLSYNGGQGTIQAAMDNAKSTMVEEFTKPEFLKPAIKTKQIHATIRNNVLKKAGHDLATIKEDSEAYLTADAGAIDRKYNEIVGYSPEIAVYVAAFNKADAAKAKSKGESHEVEQDGNVTEPTVDPTHISTDPSVEEGKKEAPQRKRYRLLVADTKKPIGPDNPEFGVSGRRPPEVDAEMDQAVEFFTKHFPPFAAAEGHWGMDGDGWLWIGPVESNWQLGVQYLRLRMPNTTAFVGKALEPRFEAFD